MKITQIALENVRGFQNRSYIELSESINIFIGPNNAGKSTILKSVLELQQHGLTKDDITVGQSEGKIELYYIKENDQAIKDGYNQLTFELGVNKAFYAQNKGSQTLFQRVAPQEPDNLIYPYLSRRKVANYQDSVSANETYSVTGDFSYLSAKITRFVNRDFPKSSEYFDACNRILGFHVSVAASKNGQAASYLINTHDRIPLKAMGEGVPNILGLIVDLCMAEGKIFLIEEIENDIHPKALKELLNFIITKSNNNQFFISTHSNIVMKHLGGVSGAKIFNVTNAKTDKQNPNLFISKIDEIPEDSKSRRQVLEDLGYELFDFDLWKGWLFLEESSAETIIHYLINWFVQNLKNTLRTFSTKGRDSMKQKFEDFNRLFVFLHLEPSYKNNVWVVIDSGEVEEKVIDEMRKKYSPSGWEESHFSQFTEHDFEKYLPQEFQDKVNQIITEKDTDKRNQAKRKLINEVKDWINKDEEKAKKEFEQSAAEVIQILKDIDRKLNQK